MDGTTFLDILEYLNSLHLERTFSHDFYAYANIMMSEGNELFIRTSKDRDRNVIACSSSKPSILIDVSCLPEAEGLELMSELILLSPSQGVISAFCDDSDLMAWKDDKFINAQPLYTPIIIKTSKKLYVGMLGENLLDLERLSSLLDLIVSNKFAFEEIVRKYAREKLTLNELHFKALMDLCEKLNIIQIDSKMAA